MTKHESKQRDAAQNEAESPFVETKCRQHEYSQLMNQVYTNHLQAQLEARDGSGQHHQHYQEASQHHQDYRSHHHHPHGPEASSRSSQ